MAQQDDDHYQPWLRNRGQGPSGTVPVEGAGRAAPAGESPAADARDQRPRTVDDLLARPAPLPTMAERPSAMNRVRDGFGRFADWTIRIGERLDIPARVEQLRLGQRAQSMVARSGSLAKDAGSAVGDLAERAADAAAPKLRAAADATREGLTKGANSARAGLGHGAETIAQGASAVKGAAKRAATQTQSRLAAATNMAPDTGDHPTSELDRLIARDGMSADGALTPDTPVTTRGLPLFADTAPVGAKPMPLSAPAIEPAPSPVPIVGAPTLTGQSGWFQSPATWALGATTIFLAGAFFGGWWTSGRVTSDAVRAAIMAEPDMLPAAMTRLQNNTASQAITRLRSRLETPFSGAWIGNADGDVTLTVFTDYACTFCRASEADIERLLREDRNLKVVFRELPILSPDSEAAARLALVAARAGRYQAMHRALFASGDLTQAARAGAATRVGVTGDAATMGDPQITREIESNIAIARELRVDGTPAWVVGNRILSGAVGIVTLRTAIAEARAAQ